MANPGAYMTSIQELVAENLSVYEQLLLFSRESKTFRRNAFIMQPSALEAILNVLTLKLQGKNLTGFDISWIDVDSVLRIIEHNFTFLQNNERRLELLLKILTLLLLLHEEEDEEALLRRIGASVTKFQDQFLDVPLYYDVIRTMMIVARERKWQQKAYVRLTPCSLVSVLSHNSIKLRKKALSVLRIQLNFEPHTANIVRQWHNSIQETDKLGSSNKSYMICQLFQIATERKDQFDAFMNVVEDLSVWNIILENCAHEDQLIRKETISVIKNILSFLNAGCKTCIENRLFKWSPDNAEKINGAWQYFFTILEILPESQTHLIMPALSLIEKLECLAIEWKQIALQLILRHGNSAVSHWAVNYMLQNDKFRVQREPLEFLLMETLNRISLFQEFDKMNRLLMEYYSSTEANEFLLTRFKDVNWGAVPFASLLDVIVEHPNKADIPVLDGAVHGMVEQCKAINALNLRQLAGMKLIRMLLKLPFRYNLKFTIPFPRILLHLETLVKITGINVHAMDKWELVFQFTDEEAIQELITQVKPFDKFIIEDVFVPFLKQRKWQDAQDLMRKMLEQNLPVAIRVMQESELDFSRTDVELKTNYLLQHIDEDSPDTLKLWEVLTVLVHKPKFLMGLEETPKTVMLMLRTRLNDLRYGACSLSGTVRLVQIASHQNGMDIVKQFLDKFSLDKSIERCRIVDAKQFPHRNTYTLLCEIYIQMLHWEAFDTLTNDRIFSDFSKLIEMGDVHVLFKALEAITFLLENRLMNPYTEVDNKRVSDVISRCFKEIEVHRRTEHFMKLMKMFIDTIFAPMKYDGAQSDEFEQWLKGDVTDYVNKIMELAPKISGLANLLFEKILMLPVKPFLCWTFFANVLQFGLMLGDVQKRDQRIEEEYYLAARISSDESLPEPMTQLQQDLRVRLMCVIYLYGLSKTSDTEATLLQLKLEKMLTETFEKISKTNPRYYADSLPHRQKLRLVQGLCVVTKLTATQPYPFLHHLLQETNQPNVNYLLELLLADSSIDTLTIINSVDKEKLKVSGIQSLFVILWLRCCKTNYFETEYINFLLPWTMAQNFSTRLYAQVTIAKLIEKFYKRPDELDSCPFANVYDAIKSYVKQGNVEINMKKGMNDFRFNTIFDYTNLLTLENIFNNIPRISGMAPEEIASTRLLRECIDFLGLTDVNLGIAINANELPVERKVNLFLSPGHGGSDNVQKKIVPVKSVEPSVDMFSDLPESVRAKKMIGEDGLIVIATFVDRPPNLGGLARTSEIFGVKQYLVNALKDVENKEFQALSMTAEKWLNVGELKYFQIFDYLQEMKAKGYTIIGAEQTTGSKQLQTIQFPKKSIVLLGHEKEGLPAHIISQLDIIVEIPQFGVVRSLNVHVTGAIFMWEYAKSHLLKQ